MSWLCPLRHEKYRTQYRAMFVMNCTVKKDEVLRYKTQQDRKQRNKKKRRGQKTETPADEVPNPKPAGMDADELYHPVQCSECSTEVAVFDKDEIYHFFNILASHCWDRQVFIRLRGKNPAVVALSASINRPESAHKRSKSITWSVFSLAWWGERDIWISVDCQRCIACLLKSPVLILVFNKNNGQTFC